MVEDRAFGCHDSGIVLYLSKYETSKGQVLVDNRKLAKAFKALSHPNRLQIYQEIMQRRSMASKRLAGCALTDFIDSLNVGAPTVSHHIKELVNADLIRVERQGKFVTCYLNEATCELLQQFFQDIGPAVEGGEIA